MTPGDPRTPTLLLFCTLALLAVAAAARAGRRGSQEEFHTGGRLLPPAGNGFALAGDQLSAAALLGVTGLVALRGHDGVLLAAGFLAAWPVVLLLAELVRNCGRYTAADVLAARLHERPVRIAAGVSAVAVSVLYLAALAAGAAGLAALLLDGAGDSDRTWVAAGLGALVVVCAACGGMRATTRIQIAAAVPLLAVAAALAGLVLARHGGDPGALLAAAAERSSHGGGPAPEAGHGRGWTDRLELASLGLALVLGAAGLPHVLARLHTVPTARAARRSAVWATGLVGACHLTAVVLGLGAAALPGPEAVRASDPAGTTAVPLLALDAGGGAGTVGGTVLFAVVAALTLVAVLATAAGVALASAAAVVHDLYTSLGRRGDRPLRGGAAVARASAVGTAAAAAGLGVLARDQNIALLVGLAFAVAASAHLPALLCTLFWRRFTTRGAVWSVCAGLVSAVGLIAVSPVVSGAPDALFPHLDFAVFPLRNPGLVSVPVGFLAGWLGTLASPDRPDEAGHAGAEIRALTGAGAA